MYRILKARKVNRSTHIEDIHLDYELTTMNVNECFFVPILQASLRYTYGTPASFGYLRQPVLTC